MTNIDRCCGTSAFGIRAPIIKEGDNIVDFVTEALIKASENHNISFSDGDIVGITEALVARAQGNYASLEQISQDIKNKYPNKVMGVVFPILSRNRFSLLLKAFARGVDKLYIQLSYPADEVGNHLISLDKLDKSGINPYTNVLSEEEYYKIFGRDNFHVFTGLDYVKFYKSLSPNIEVIFSNNPKSILKYTKDVLCADIHTRERTKKMLKEAGANIVYTMADILSGSVNGSGFNPDYGILGSNMATDEKVKLFPKDCFKIVEEIQKSIKNKTRRNVEVLVFGDGCFKDPVGGIWELADPVVSPGYTKGLEGSPQEVKIKYLADNHFAGKEDMEKHIKDAIANKKKTNIDDIVGEGTTPRRYVDLIGSLCDLTTGSGEKGTPIVWIKGYFDNYASK